MIFFSACERPADLIAALRRVPAGLRGDEAVHFLCVPGAAPGWAGADLNMNRATGARNLTVLRLPQGEDLGLGGQQKLALRFALDLGCAQVLHLRGDGGDPPEALPLLLAAFTEHPDADVVLGVRPQRPLRERVLGRLQRALSGQPIGDFFTSMRGYSARFLRRVFFEVNDNGPDFDVDLLLQACHAGARIIEVPLGMGLAPGGASGAPALEHGSGRRRGPGLSALRAGAQLRMHQLGMLCSLKYQGGGPEVYEDKTQMRYSSHREALKVVAALRPRTLLDLGSGPGFIAHACESLGVRVTGLDLRAPLPGRMSDFVMHDLEQDLPVDPFAHDMVLMLDVIEHLARPEAFLIALRNRSRALRPGQPATRMVLSTPNVAFAAIRANLLFGRFNYAERGILDITHKRLFTRSSLLAALRDCGYRVERTLPIGVPFEAVLRGRAGATLGRVSDLLARTWPTLFAFQIMVICTPLPGLRQILAQSERLTASAEGTAEPQ